MGKAKDSSKNRKWEQLRRERLNQTFSDLCKELPCKPNGALLSKKTILVEALAFIQQLQREKKALQNILDRQHNPRLSDDLTGTSDVRNHIGILLRRQSQLLQILRDAGIATPPDPNAEQVSAEWAPKIFQNAPTPPEEKDLSTSEKNKTSAVTLLANGVVNRVVLAEKTKPMNPLSRKNKESTIKKKLNKRIVGQGPILLQSLHSQLVVTPGTSPASVPVIVSVAGVKTINPVLVVQSKPLVSCNTTSSYLTRPIRPCPAVRPSGAKAKVPIPALKRKPVHSTSKKTVPSKGRSVPVKNESAKDVLQMPAKSVPSIVTSPEITTKVDENVTLSENNVEVVSNRNELQNPSIPIEVRPSAKKRSQENGCSSKMGCEGLTGKENLNLVVSKRVEPMETTRETHKQSSGFINGAPVESGTLISSPSKNNPKSGVYSISALCSFEEQQDIGRQNQLQENLQEQQRQHNELLDKHQEGQHAQIRGKVQPTDTRRQDVHQQNLQEEQNRPCEVQGQHNQQPEEQRQQNRQPVEQGQQSRQPVEQCQQNRQPVEQCQQNRQPVEQCQQNRQPVEQCQQNRQPVEPCQQNRQPEEQCQQNRQPVEQCQQNRQPVEQCQQNRQPVEQCQQNRQEAQQTQEAQHEQNHQEVLQQPNQQQEAQPHQNQQQHVQQHQDQQLHQGKRQKKPHQQVQQHPYQIQSLHQSNVQHQQLDPQACPDPSVKLSTSTSHSTPKPACVVSKGKEMYVPSTDQYLEWVEKSGSKSRFDSRTFTYNTFSTPMVHNSRNSFMPISETEMFDASENAFGLSLNAPDLSGDLFTSLQVPNGSQHSESISPTAAFLLTFPLVSTSKATELLPDESVCDNADSQSGMKTILQIGNIDNDSSNKCSNIFSVADDGLNNYSLAAQFAPNSSGQKDTHALRNTVEDKTPSLTNKECTSGPILYKNITGPQEATQKMDKSLDQNGLHHMHQSSQKDKTDLQSSSVVSAVDVRSATHSVVTSSVGTKSNVPNKCSTSSEAEKPSRDRKEDRNSSWTATSSQHNMIPHNPFGDFVVSNTLRQDSSLNYAPLPSPVIPHNSANSTSQSFPVCEVGYKASYSQPNANSTFSIAQTSSNMGILSWSTLPSTDGYSSRNNPKLARFHDIFSYRPTGSNDSTSTACYVNGVLPSDPKMQTNCVQNSTDHSFFQEPSTSADTRPKTSYSNASRLRSDASNSHFEETGKKQYPSRQNYDQGMAQCTLTSNSLSQYSNISQTKIDYHKTTTTNNEGKQISSNDLYSRQPVNGGKHASFGNCTDPKETQSFSFNVPSDPKNVNNVQFSNVNSSKKSSSSVFHSSKERVMVGTFITNVGSVSETRMLQCNQTDSNNIATQKDGFKAPEHFSQDNKQPQAINHKNLQKQYHEPDLHQETNEVHRTGQQSSATARPSKSMSIHRPPVNWMTAPDIRSSLQNSPAFGNNQYYLPDHQKEVEGSIPGPMFDTNAFHCLELPHSSGQMYKGTDSQLLGNDQLENMNEPTAWSPSKSGNNVLGSMLIPSTLPTLVGDLALGDSSVGISRPFLPSFSAESSPCSKRTSKRIKNSDKTIDDGQVNFLSVSQLVESGVNRKRVLPQSISGDAPCYPVTFPDQDLSKSKCPSSSYSAEALLSNSVMNPQHVNRKKRPNSSHYSNYVHSDTTASSYSTSQTQCHYIPDLSVPRSNDFQGGLSHSDAMPPPFILATTPCNTGASHRTGIHTEDEAHTRRTAQGASDNVHIAASMTANKPIPGNSNGLDVGMTYESNFPSFLPPVSGAMTHHPYTQDTMYSAPRFQMPHNANNSNIQSPSASSLTNFHLSTIFPEINGKVLC